MKISFTLKGDGKDFETELKALKGWKLDMKINQFLEECGKLGIEVAENNSGQYAGLLSFTKEIDGRTLTITGTDLTTIQRQWVRDGGIKVVEVSPFMLAEYGSGNFFLNNWDNGIDKNTSIYMASSDPSSDMINANKSVWYWKTDYTAPLEHSSGEAPTMPMYNAFIALQNEIGNIARSVFGEWK